jgi:hypothetical protein
MPPPPVVVIDTIPHDAGEVLEGLSIQQQRTVLDLEATIEPGSCVCPRRGALDGAAVS